MTKLLQDVRYGLRLLARSRAFTAVAVVSLALGVGVNTAVFSVVNAALLRALPYEQPERIVLLWGDYYLRGESRSQVSATDVADWRAQANSFAAVSTYGDWRGFLSGDGEPELVTAAQVGDGYFDVMRGRAMLGRTFLPEEQEEGKDFVVVLGHGLWQRRFAGDPSIVGRAINLSGRPYTVVGVMPPDFRSLPKGLLDESAELYRPVAEPYDETERSARHLRAIARLKDGATIEQAQAEMASIAARIERAKPDSNANYGVRVAPLREDLVGALRPALLTLSGAVAFVLLIACANVGNLLLARSSARRKEIAIRAALGAGRARIVRQLLTESVLLAVLGGALGLLLAMWGTSLIEAVGAQLVPWLGRIEIDRTVLAFTAATSLLTGIVFGLAPALQVSRPDLNETLKEGGRGAGAGRSRLRSALVVAEVAVALTLLVCAGLLIRSVAQLRGVDPGFRADGVVTMNVWLPRAKFTRAEEWRAVYAQVVARVEALPGVEAAGMTSTLPTDGFDQRTVEIEGRAYKAGERPDVDSYYVTPNYLRAMSVPVVRGRALTAADDERAQPVALVSQELARRMWPGEDPIGKRLRYYGDQTPQPWMTVVGVVGDVRQYGLDAPATAGLYVPEALYPLSSGILVVRTSSDPAGQVASIRREIVAVNKDLAVYKVETMAGRLSGTILLRRFSMLLLGTFAALALLLAAVGIYGVVSYTVAQRRHEIGIRMALGASPGDVLRMMVRQGMALALSGVAVGLAASFALTRLMRGLLYGVTATDPATFAAVAALLASVALLACLVPARRATKVDPTEALRYE